MFNSFLFVALTTFSHAQEKTAHHQFNARVLNLSGKTEYYNDKRNINTPLGSLYKIFIYSYLSEVSALENTYTCNGKDTEEIFCCKPGDTINRDLALAKSCTPYFSGSRLHITSSEWKEFWEKKNKNAPEWLKDLSRLKPETQVPVNEILVSLAEIRKNFKTIDQIEKAMMGTVIYGTAKDSVKTWGSTLKVKTYTWRDESVKDNIDELGFTGGFAGWLPDGSSIWVSNAGHGRDGFQKELKSIVENHSQTVDAGCVEVKYFDKYPIESISSNQDQLKENIFIKFKNGSQVSFFSDGSLKINRNSKKISVTGIMSINEYVGRVLDREVNAQPIEAAKAFSIAIRTFLFQNSKLEKGCRKIADSSSLQRVSPSPASTEALKIARWSDGLTLDRIENLRYHSDKTSKNRMSWLEAKQFAEKGFSMSEILKTFYPEGLISFGQSQIYKCVPDLKTTKWLKGQSSKWRERLNAERGFEWPLGLKVCQIPEEAPLRLVFANMDNFEIFVPGSKTINDEVSIIHEYLHIGFRNHPRGQDERYIESLARLLQEEK